VEISGNFFSSPTQCRITGLRKSTDEELYRRLKNGDRDALVELYERREPGLYRYALYASGSRSVAEEVTQEVFLRLIGGGVPFDERRGTLEAYLYGVARNLMRMRPVPIAVPLDAEGAGDRAAEEDTLGGLISDQRTAALLAAVRELPAGYQDAVVMCDLEERSYEEAARLMNCAVGTVRSRLHRARALLAARLKGLESGGTRREARERRVAT
jgi:RNA polymerase sigma-70 factor (ECF subfamily)